MGRGQKNVPHRAVEVWPNILKVIVSLEELPTSRNDCKAKINGQQSMLQHENWQQPDCSSSVTLLHFSAIFKAIPDRCSYDSIYVSWHHCVGEEPNEIGH